MSHYFLSILFVALLAQNPPAPLPLTIENVAPDLYVIRGEAGNTTVYVTDEGVVLVDVKFERNFDDMMAKVKSVTDKPVKYVINTHGHGDHTGGNQKLLSSAQIIAHKNARAGMIEAKLPGIPQITYTDQLGLNLGGKEIVARYFGRAHTSGDTWVTFPAARVLATGDSFTTANGQGLNPTKSPTYGFIIAADGSFNDITKTLDEVLKLDFDVVVPGHGPVAKRAEVMAWRADIERLRTRIGAMVREGKSKEEIQKMILSEFRWDPMGNPLRQIDKLMADVKQ